MTDGTSYGRSFILSIDPEASPVAAWSQVLDHDGRSMSHDRGDSSPLGCQEAE